jgi:serine/threonine protein kinase
MDHGEDQVTPPPGFRSAVLCGTGATSRVFRALEESTGRVLALKRLHRQMVRGSETLARLRRELEALSALRHPSLVRVHDVIRWEGDPTIVMDYVPGVDLKERVVRGGPLPFDEAERVARAMLDVLATAHAAGIVHRDVKPQNIRLDDQGHVFLLDFGSARLCAASHLTATGTTVGTPEYMAPELFAGSVYDPRVDVYGVGATIFECVTGRPPQTADSLAELAFQRTHQDAPLLETVLPGAPLGLRRLVDRSLAQDPEQRFPSASLAVWALDHPGLESSFSAQTSRFPLCLHCHEPLHPESATCGHCKSDHPFRLAAGSSHVVLEAVTSPVGWMERWVRDFPERSSPGHLLALADRCAALSFSRLRYASFIDDDEAKAVVQDLASVGVRARTVQPTRPVTKATLLWSGITLLALGLMGGWALLLFALLIGGGIWVTGRVVEALEARQSVLAGGKWGRVLWPSAYRVSLVLSGLMLASSALGTSELTRTRWWFTLAASLLLLGISTVARMRPDRVAARMAPEPGWKAKLKQLLVRAAPKKKDGTSVAPARVGPVGRAAFLVVFLGLVPLEVYLLGSIEESRLRRTAATWIQEATSPKASGPVATTPTGVKKPGDTHSSPRQGVRRSSSVSVSAADALGSAVPWIPFSGLAAACLVLVRRWRRARRDAALIFSEVDLAAMQRLSERTPPASRQALGRHAPADRLAALAPRDAFAAEAVKRAATLGRWLPAEALSRLSASIEALENGRGKQAERDRSLLARCIAETDPAQKARFDLLAMEGRLEAEAAEAWASRIKGKPA